jgi:aspartyl-tRNA(Asn)/glutamyl-tRNA(Gln) amidotransferase subunit A
MSAAALARRLRARELSPREAVETYLARIEEAAGLNAFIGVRAEEALAEADALERAPTRGPLHGVPIAVKDVIDVAGVPTTAGSKILDRLPERDADVVARLRGAGAIVLGKLNTHEFACGATTTSPHFGPARNPWDTERTCGGSSGGSGCATAAGLAAATLGTDTSGSVRIPAAFCGVTGFRPSTGLLAARGVFPFAWSFDTVGPLGRGAADCALLLEAMAGLAPAAPAADLRGLRVGVVAPLFERGVDPRVAAVVTDAVGELERLGARVEQAELPLLERMGMIQQAMQFPEATALHEPWLRTRLADYGDDVRARLLTGLFLPATTYVTGRRARGLAIRDFERAFDRFDLLVAPAMPTPAPPIGQETIELDGQEVPFRVALIRFNSPWSLVGAPVASVPAGFVDGLPVGLALVGPRFGDAGVLAAAHAFQQATDWHERAPGRVSPAAGSHRIRA